MIVIFFYCQRLLIEQCKGIATELEQAFSPGSVLFLPHGLREASADFSGYYSFSFERNDISTGLVHVIRLNRMLVEKFEGGLKLLGHIY